jgi:hypothetical protein
MSPHRTSLLALLAAWLVVQAALAAPVAAGPSGNAAFCAAGGHRYLTDVNGDPFPNAGQCIRAARQSTATITVYLNLVQDFGHGPGNDFLVSGTGFLPDTPFTVRFITDNGTTAIGPDPYRTLADGTFHGPFSWGCNTNAGSINYITVSDGTNVAFATQEILCQ